MRVHVVLVLFPSFSSSNHRILAIETGGCPHAAIREDISANLGACETLTARHNADIVLVESGGGALHSSRHGGSRCVLSEWCGAGLQATKTCVSGSRQRPIFGVPFHSFCSDSPLFVEFLLFDTCAAPLHLRRMLNASGG